FDTPERPLAGIPAVVISSRGNTYAAGTPGAGTDYTVPPLRQVLGVSMGMDVTVVTVDLTLAERIPAMAALAEQAEGGAAAARATVRRLAEERACPTRERRRSPFC